MGIARGLCLLVPAAAMGCGGAVATGGSGSQGPQKPLQVYTWFTAGAEGKAFDALANILQMQDPAIVLTNPVLAGDTLPYSLKGAVASGHPPDSFQVVSGSDLGSWIGRDAVAPLDGLAAAQGWADAIPPDVLALGRIGSLHGVPLDVERDNIVFYNKTVLAAHGVAPPQTLADVMAAAGTLESDGVTAFAVSARAGWTIATQLFEDVLVAQAGGAFFRAYFTGQKTADTPEIRAALATLGSMMDHASPDRTMLGWTDALTRLCRGDAAMLMLPDFVVGVAMSDLCAPCPLGYAPMQPAGSSTFVLISTAFTLARQAADPAAGSEFLAVAGSKAGQEAFDAALWRTPARTDVDPSLFGPIVRQMIADYRAGGESFVPGYGALTPTEFQSAVNAALVPFVDPSDPAYKNADAVIAVLAQNYALLQQP